MSRTIIDFGIFGTNLSPIAARMASKALRYTFRRYGPECVRGCDDATQRKRFIGCIHGRLCSSLSKPGDHSIKPIKADLTALIVYLAPSGVVSNE